MTDRIDIECGGKTITIERLPNGDVVVHGIDIEKERSLAELGFEPHRCLIAIDNRLWQATEVNLKNVVKLLLDAGADVHAYADFAIRSAVRYDYPDVVKILLEAGADPLALGGESLIEAARRGNTDIVKILLDYDFDIETVADAASQAEDEFHFDIAETLDDYWKNKFQ